MTALDLDPQFIQALRLLQSPNKDSAEQLRNLLDEAIKQKYGTSKMLSNTLHKKYTMEEPVLSDQSSTSSKKSKSSNSSKYSKSSKNNSPITIRETTPDPLQSDDNLRDILLDVACVICKGMDFAAKNQLVECVKCRALYHQECHTPHILDSEIETNPVEWYCCNCTKTPLPPKEQSVPKSLEIKNKDPKKSSSTKHSDKYKSSSQSQSSNGSSSSSSKSNTQIFSSDRRLKEFLKKGSKGDKRSRNSTSKHSHSSSKNSHDKTHKNKAE